MSQLAALPPHPGPSLAGRCHPTERHHAHIWSVSSSPRRPGGGGGSRHVTLAQLPPQSYRAGRQQVAQFDSQRAKGRRFSATRLVLVVRQARDARVFTNYKYAVTRETWSVPAIFGPIYGDHVCMQCKARRERPSIKAYHLQYCIII